MFLLVEMRKNFIRTTSAVKKMSRSVRSIRAAASASSARTFHDLRSTNHQHHENSKKRAYPLINTNIAQNRPAINQRAASRIVMQMTNIDYDGFTASEIMLMDHAWVLSYRLFLAGLAMAFTTKCIRSDIARRF